MGTVAQKLIYLNNTKTMFKDRLNSLGAEIISSTTFRNYLTYLDSLFNATWNKTDLSVNGIQGMTSQDGTPTPESPIPINNLSGDITYKVSSRNILNIDGTRTSEGLTSITSGTIISVSGTSTNTYSSLTQQITQNIPIGTYTFSIQEILSQRIGFIATFNDNTSSTYHIEANSLSTTFTTTKLITSYRLYMETVNDTIYNMQIKPQLEKGQIASGFEPYISRTFSVTLGDIELCNISTYKDKIYAKDNKFYLYKEIKSVILNGNEFWGSGGVSNVYYTTLITDYSTSNNIPISNYYTGVINVNGAGEITTNNTIGFINQSGQTTPRFYIKDNNLSTTNELISWLGTHNLSVCYLLQTPTIIEITSTNYSTLYNQLNDIQDYLIKYKLNKEFILDFSSPNIEY